MTRTWSAAVVVLVSLIAGVRPAYAQPAEVEVAVTAGGSTQSTGGAATQVRLSGEPLRGLRYFIEGVWSKTSGTASDVLGASYPYDGRLEAMETYAEGDLRRGARFLAVRGGRYRTPFGVHDRGDHAYSGFLRPPMIRYGDSWGVPSTLLEGGVDVSGGVPALHGEVSLGVPQDHGVAPRRHGFVPVIRIEGYHDGLIIGASHIRSRPYEDEFPVHGNLVFSGVDARYMRAGVQLRGEWAIGRPFDGATTRGGYVDLFVHRPGLGPWTLVARAEKLDYFAGRFSRFDTRYTGGARLQLPHALVAQVNLVHQPSTFYDDTHRTALDAALTWVVRFPR